MLVQLLKGILRASREALPFRAQKTAAERQTASAGDWTSIRSRPVFLLGKLISLVDCVISIAPRKSNISPARAHETRRKPRRYVRKSVVSGKGVQVRLEFGCRRI